MSQFFELSLGKGGFVLHIFSTFNNYRDLNPCNILIDAKGDVKLTYFSKVHGVDYTLDQDAVDLLYAAPGETQALKFFAEANLLSWK